MKENNFMKVAGIIGFVTLFVFYSSQTFGQEKKDESTEKLMKRIESLEKLVKDQGKQIESLQSDLNKMRNESPLATIPPLGNNLKGFEKYIPFGSTPFKFNGQTYYMVPLNKLTGEKKGLMKYK